MSPQPRGLGRGLGALIPAGPPPAPTAVIEEPVGAGVRDVAVDNIMPNPRQPRSVIAPDTLSELAASIREIGRASCRERV